MKMILFNQNPMITKLLESVSKKLELSMEDFNRYQELSTRLKEEPEWILIADDECLEKLDQVDWLELKEIISQNKNSVCMYKKGNEAQPFLEGFEMKIKKPFLPTEVLKVLQKKLGFQPSESEPNPTNPLEPAQETLETNWDELENLGDLEALVQEEPNNEEQLLPTLNNQKEKEEIKEEVKETPQEEEKPKDDEIQEGETQKNEEASKELETQEEVKEETQENKEEKQEETQEEVKEETQENKEEKQEETQDSPSAQELEAMQELVKEIQENSNGQEDKKEAQENTETPQDIEIPQAQEKETQELEIPKEEIQEETQENAETPQENTETPQEKETQKLETLQEEIQENTEKTQKLETQEDHYESIEDIPEPVMAQAMGEELPFLNESVAKTSNNENDTETPKESVIKTPQEKEESIETPKESNKTSSPLELRLNLQDLLKSLNQESLKSLLENKTLSIKITLEDKKPDA
ncbi:chemotaxis regulatory protein ChePep [Helicobacter pylori]